MSTSTTMIGKRTRKYLSFDIEALYFAEVIHPDFQELTVWFLYIDRVHRQVAKFKEHRIKARTFKTKAKVPSSPASFETLWEETSGTTTTKLFNDFTGGKYEAAL